jgi:uncharacterized protein YjbI with pentapeptide repeats
MNNWTGFLGKTLWDWLGLLIIPLMLSLIAYWFSKRERENSERTSNNAINAAALQTYITDVEKMLLENGLRLADKNSEIRILARAKTLTLVQTLDGARKGFVINFLSELGLIDSDSPIIDLENANLSNTILRCSYLNGINLNNTNLENADFTSTILSESTFSKSNLEGAQLCSVRGSSTNFSNSNLKNAVINRAYLTGSNFGGANLEAADLRGANFREANLVRANLTKTKVGRVHGFPTNFTGADLTEAILDKSGITAEQLSKAKH